MRQQIPNLITLGNLFCGCCALLCVLAARPDVALWFMLGSFAFDTADGLVARALGVSSPLGIQLDSLADVVSFGVVPGAMLYYILSMNSVGPTDDPGSPDFWSQVLCLPALPAFVLTLAGAYRLGKFNVDTRQTNYFLGLSTPACSVFMLGLALHRYRVMTGDSPFGGDIGTFLPVTYPWFMYGIIALFSWLMVSEIPLAGMKIKGFGWRGNEALFSILLLFMVLLFLIKELAFCAIIIVYIFYSLLNRKRILNNA